LLAKGFSNVSSEPRIAIVGAGLGGLATAAVLKKFGIASTVYEQASAFARVGAGINVSPNATHALAELGLYDELMATACRPDNWTNATAGGQFISEAALGEVAQARYGMPFLQMHRADLHSAVLKAVDSDSIRHGHKLQGLENTRGAITLNFEGGRQAEADIVIGADGLHSRVRLEAFGPSEARFTGRIAYRGVVPAVVAPASPGWEFVKWWGEDRHIVTYYIAGGREIYYVTSIPADDWRDESWSARGDIKELRDSLSGFPPYVRDVLGVSDTTHKWALYVREPMDTWVEGNVALLGDSCHPMTPYMAQGAAMAFEDAAVLGRAIAATPNDIAGALRAYETSRLARTASVQLESGRNRFMKDGGFPDWVYGYNAWDVPLGVEMGAALETPSIS
jgi:salicylate hydroxylase/6-hydroxynicotinate 3-monooxygenase